MAVLIRSYAERDVAGVVDVFARSHQVEPTVPLIDARGWTRFVSLPMSQGGSGFRVAVEEDTVLGASSSSWREAADGAVRHFRIVVDPLRRRQGIGSALLRALAELDSSDASLQMQSLCPVTWHDGIAFLQRRRFQAVESEYDMACGALTRTPRAVAGWHIELASNGADFAAPAAALHNAAYAADHAFVAYTPEEMAEVLQGANLWLLRRDGELHGFCHLAPATGDTWMESLVVDPAFQGRGLGAWLCHVAVSYALAQSGRVCLQVSSANSAACHIYEAAGFHRIAESVRLRAPRTQVVRALGEGH